MRDNCRCDREDSTNSAELIHFSYTHHGAQVPLPGAAKHKLPRQTCAPHSNLWGKSERCFWLLVWMQAYILPRGVMKHLSSSNFAAVWDTFCLPPPQSCSHLLQLLNTLCATVCHTHLPFCSPFREISFFRWVGERVGAGNLHVGASLLPCYLLFLKCFWKSWYLLFHWRA